MKIFFSFAAADRDRVGKLMILVRKAGFEVDSVDGVLARSPITAVASEILSSRVIVAVISSDNPNVFYELGLAVGAGLPAVIVAIGDVLLPNDLASMPFLRLTDDVARDAGSLLLHLRGLNLGQHEQRLPSGSIEEMLVAATRDTQLLEKLSPAKFEQMIGELLESRGWSIERSTARRDAEADFILSDPTTKKVTIVEVKKINSQGRVSVDAVRQFLGHMSVMGVSSGILVSTAGFTSSALAMAADTGAVLITLNELLSSRLRLTPSDISRT
ncbi:hypothetical protein SAE02_78210 [Skermanella aerolata]|uniref:Restriction endonuclease type IV Mrr domain-containing protein n=1 Tax=Skermanella aerolata TaxID=393310 RepID=A0A512E4Q4_9PROT|nr:restriction endonuclease [Skermanella aerolata]KJB90054.1 hypothetical protein N826_07485 [Skermanella aerolata KACC 11604]GEO43673.1 hypothetical protein SAE02_78210 [Skermanella aerolata]